jgi:3D (Asp-Asp-Asp) domain-containing protein
MGYHKNLLFSLKARDIKMIDTSCKTRHVIALHVLIASLVACGGEVEVSDGAGAVDMQRVTDLSTPQDMRARMPDIPAAQDQGMPRDTGALDMPTLDMGTMAPGDMQGDMLSSPPDMPDEQPWPMYSGTACDVDGVQGICLPTSRCPGHSVAGECPGPADMQCCLQGCQTSAQQPGQCATQGMCEGWAVSNTCAGPSGEAGCCEVSDEEGTPIASLWNTYYYLAKEDDYPGTKNTALNSSSCQGLVDVSAAFSDAVCIEGSGRLSDGRVINYASTCSCGRPCPTGGIVCYSVLDKTQFPWGKGARSNPLVPMRSLAVDRSTIALGTTVYLREWDGYEVPSLDGVGGFTHDGCFRADDVGGAIQGPHIDIFSGTKAMYLRLEQDFPTRTSYTSFTNAPRCAYLK